MIPTSLSAIAELLDCPAASLAQREVREVVRDSRQAGPGCVYVALRGERCDGHDFVGQALAQGAEACVVELGFARSRGGDFPEGRLLPVFDTLSALGSLGRDNRRRSGATTIAITGSVGKTTSKEWLAAALATSLRTVKAPHSYNNAVGVPLTLLQATADTEAIVCELGTNNPGEIEALARLAEPDVALLTAIGAGHLKGLGSVAGVAAEKSSLFRHLRRGGQGFANGNDPRVVAAAELLAWEGIELQLTGARGDSCLRGEIVARQGSRCELQIDGLGTRTAELFSPRLLDNLLLVLAAARSLGIPLEHAFEAACAAELPGGRQRIEHLRGLRLIDDAYNANPLSMQAALEALAGYPARRVACLGDMLELGADSLRFHRLLGQQAAAAQLDKLLCVGQFADEVAAGAREGGLSASRVCVVARPQLEEALLASLRPGDTVLLKASRRLGLEQVLPPLRARFAATA